MFYAHKKAIYFDKVEHILGYSCLAQPLEVFDNVLGLQTDGHSGVQRVAGELVLVNELRATYWLLSSNDDKRHMTDIATQVRFESTLTSDMVRRKSCACL